MITCKICNQEFENYAYLSSHIRFQHKITSYEYSLKYDYNGEVHKCKCGCGQETKWFNINIGFYDFVKGHDNTFRHQQSLITKKCIICGKEFKTKNKNKEICTDRKCYQKDLYNKTHEIRTCSCGEKFECSKKSKQIYCSFDCARKDPNLYEKMRQTLIEKYGVDNYSKTDEFKKWASENTFFKTEEFQIKTKRTKEERYNDENYNNRPKYKSTMIETIGVDNYFKSEQFYKDRKSTSTSEQKVLDCLNFATGSFVYENKEFDIKVENDIFEIDGNFYHPSTLNNLSFIQLNGIINDYNKNKLIEYSTYSLYRIHTSDLPKEITIDNLKINSYIPDYSISYYQIIMNKEYLKNYKLTKGEDKLERYIKLLIKFLKTFQLQYIQYLNNEILNLWNNDNIMANIIKDIIGLCGNECIDFNIENIVLKIKNSNKN